MLLAAFASLMGVVAGESRGSLDGEELGNDADAVEGRGIARARRVRETAPSMAPASWTFASGALQECGHAGAVALHGAREIVAEEATHAV